MISEREFARGFGAFWKELFPLLTPQFVRIFNQAYPEPLINPDGSKLKPVPIAIENENPSIVAEMAFYIAKRGYENGSTASEAVKNSDLVKSAEFDALMLAELYEGENIEDAFNLSQIEQEEAKTLAQIYDTLIAKFPEGSKVIFNPKLNGAGFLNSCQADLAIGSTIFEIKTANRNFAGKDLRQLFIYLALNAAMGEQVWRNAGFFNPRRALVAEFQIDTTIYRLSGGKTHADTFDELISFVSSRAAELDMAF